MTERRTSPRRATRSLLALVLLVSGLVGVTTASGAAAADLTQFRPGYIISDATFVASGAMSAADVQAFLDARAPSCRPGNDGTPCLRTARFDTWTRPADDRCRGTYVGAGNESAAAVITKVAQACGINPRVLLVMLQKEQGLITASGSSLTASRYQKAMGFGCPDTAPCDTRYYGFYNQLYQAAWQLNNYALNPTRYAHRAGMVNNVRFHPNAACGSSPVLIQNQATASLYNYTPYQPNAAALAAGYGTGDACSSYGNRNFWNYFTDWFGRPDGADPIGVVEAVTATNTTLTVSGWTLDPDTSASTEVHVYVDGVGTSAMADRSRPDVAAAYGKGDRHGFLVTVPAAPGPRSVCTFGISSGPGNNTLLDCRTVVVPDAVPIGAVTSVTAGPDSLTVVGWTLDPDTSAPTEAHIYVDGVGVAVRADRPVAGLNAAHGRGDNHGFTHTVKAKPGARSVCVFGINTAAGANTLLDCRTVVVGASRPPIGSFDGVSVSGSRATVWGWTLDPDTDARTEAHVYVDGVGVSVWADQNRPDVAAAFGVSPARGFSDTRTLAPGQHQACVYAIDTAGGANTLLGCRSFAITNARPMGFIDVLQVDGSRMTVSGWTWDPDTASPNEVHIYVDGVGVALSANLPRPDVAAAHQTSPQRGYTHSRDLAPGRHTVCVYSIDTAGGPHTDVGCRTFTTS
ncbi:hypothetical protein [Cellulomonas phragmiteti]|uniref:Hemagglutinin n=1 Tax=Cellulomonas phragmiteti TaxID=478780 RepID=A0ABQ4DKS7_9CELL|nr:hypothetical protein [Cellulomonas phragmiteti]GIG39607.1 hypothetical protein Cph01nite_13690 [Cellulomonas phragmiteti]